MKLMPGAVLLYLVTSSSSHTVSCVYRKLLISDINDLRARQLEEKSSGAGQTDVKDDPVVLKLKLA